MEKRKNFYENELNMDRVEEAIGYLAENLTLKECLKAIRKISYDMVAYYGEDNCAAIYKDGRHNKHVQEQACRIQRGLSTMCDLFAQSVIQVNEFDDDYLAKWLDGGYLQLKVNSLEEEIEKLKEEIKELKNDEE